MYNMYSQNYNPNYNQNNNQYNPNLVQQAPNLQYYLDYQRTLENQLNQVNQVIAQNQPPQIPQQQIPQQVPQQNPQNISPQQQALLELEALIDRSVKANLSQIQQTNQNPASVKIIQAIGSNLSEEDQVWLSSNMEQFADFVMTPEGKDVVNFVLESYKSYHGIDVKKKVTVDKKG